MVAKIDNILKQAMEMDATDRALLAERLIASLDPEPEEGVEIAWQAEIARRLAEIDSGKVKPVLWDEAIESIRRELRERHPDTPRRET